jgi:hypothetical protein|nr:MAG TPA: hypothetical protein [Caudoviricetes sp.]
MFISINDFIINTHILRAPVVVGHVLYLWYDDLPIIHKSYENNAQALEARDKLLILINKLEKEQTDIIPNITCK